MSSVYHHIKRNRTDISDWLIHFTSQKNTFSALDTLSLIVKNGIIKPSWAFRNNKRTVYGVVPVVCFTEQPLIAFTNYLKSRPQKNISGYGIVVHKADVFDLGGLPVIYGVEKHVEEELAQDGSRLLLSTVLPLQEQFRYVAFNPSKTDKPLDWSHEREWRWPMRGDNHNNPYNLEGFPLRTQRGTHIIVEKRIDIERISELKEEVLKLDRQLQTSELSQSLYLQQWYRYFRYKSQVISLEEVIEKTNQQQNHGRMEGWLEDIKE